MTTNPSQHSATELGMFGEDIAAEALAAAGYRILIRRWLDTAGEVDIIAYHRQQLVAIEVKTRRGTDYGDPLAAVTPHQLRRIQRGLLRYKQSVYPKYAHSSVRIDILGITVDAAGDVTAELLEDVA